MAFTYLSMSLSPLSRYFLSEAKSFDPMLENMLVSILLTPTFVRLSVFVLTAFPSFAPSPSPPPSPPSPNDPLESPPVAEPSMSEVMSKPVL